MATQPVIESGAEVSYSALCANSNGGPTCAGLLRMDHESATLWERNQEILVCFLKIDIEFAATFLDIAAITGDEASRGNSLAKAQRAIESVREFAKRVEDDDARVDILARIWDAHERYIDFLKKGLPTKLAPLSESSIPL